MNKTPDDRRDAVAGPVDRPVGRLETERDDRQSDRRERAPQEPWRRWLSG